MFIHIFIDNYNTMLSYKIIMSISIIDNMDICYRLGLQNNFLV